MTSPETSSRLNVDAFQVWFANDRLEAIAGVAVGGVDTTHYVDPQNELDYPGSFSLEPSGHPELCLGLDEANSPPVINERLYFGSIPARETDVGYALFPPEAQKTIAAPSATSIGRAALIGIVERPDFTVTKLVAGLGHETRRLESHGAVWRSGYQVNLFLLPEDGKIRVVCGPNKSPQRYELAYNSATGDVIIQERQGNDGHGTDYEEGSDDNDGPGPGGDREPRYPVTPAGSAAAELEEPLTKEEPLVLQGRAA
ncbi:MAG TPA: hypothetical protein VK712_04210 [Verrucomicrobiae bacterium]|jgi:hypothetical protein|nr:hypothetical protein [Verrucomicrobiae bacterium]